MYTHALVVALVALQTQALPLVSEDGDDLLPPLDGLLPPLEGFMAPLDDLIAPADYPDEDLYGEERTELPVRKEHEDSAYPPVTTNRDLEHSANHSLEEGNLTSARAMAKLSYLDRLLRALGPQFTETLPKAPTNDTLATVPTPINITAEPCPYKYKRCTSETFFPSCDIPRNTDPEVWPQSFNLFFNLSADFDNKLDVINATLRLFKNDTIPTKFPKTLMIRVLAYTRSLTRRRAKTQQYTEVEVPSDYIGWVNLPVDRMVKRWKKQKNNHGLLVTVTDNDMIPWGAPALFVNMDCASGNASLVPLPFEVQTDEEGQRYPALNVRQGSLDDEPFTYDEYGQVVNSEPFTYDEYGHAYPNPIPTAPSVGDTRPNYGHDATHVHGHAHTHSRGRPYLATPEYIHGSTHDGVRDLPVESVPQPGHVSSVERLPANGRGVSVVHGRGHNNRIQHGFPTHGQAFDTSLRHTPILPYSTSEDNVSVEVSHRQHVAVANARFVGDMDSFDEYGEARQEPSQVAEEPRLSNGSGHRNRGGSRERRQRRKHHGHHRRGEERRGPL